MGVARFACDLSLQHLPVLGLTAVKSSLICSMNSLKSQCKRKGVVDFGFVTGLLQRELLKCIKIYPTLDTTTREHEQIKFEGRPLTSGIWTQISGATDTSRRYQTAQFLPLRAEYDTSHIRTRIGVRVRPFDVQLPLRGH